MSTTASVRVIGVDPGPIPGVVVLDVVDGRLVSHGALQCSAGLTLPLVERLVSQGPHDVVLVQVEKFHVGRRAARSTSPGAGQTTRDLVGALQGWVDVYGDTGAGKPTSLVQRTAAAVKPWATDDRLERAGLAEATKGMRHARDAARHALFCAVHDAGLSDPLSKEFRR